MMNLKTTSGQLRAALAPFKRLIEKWNRYPALGCVVIDGDAGTITGSNLDQWMRVSFATSGASSGRAGVDYVTLAGLVHAIPVDVDVSLAVDDERATVAFGAARYELPSLAPASLGDWAFDEDGSGTISGSGLKRAITDVIWAVDEDFTRYYLNGVCFSANERFGEVLVATDGHRMAATPFPVPQAFNGLILPSVAWPILKYLPDPETIRITEKGMSFRWPGMELVSKLIDGTYPDYTKVWPERTKYRFNLDARALSAIARRQGIMGSGRHYAGSEMLFALGADRCAIGARGEGGDVIGAEVIGYTNKPDLPDAPVSISYSRRFLRDTLKALAEDVLTFHFSDASGPAELSRPDGSLRTLLMPIRGSNDAYARNLLAEMAAEQRVAAE